MQRNLCFPDEFNILIEATKYALCQRHTTYPSEQNEAGVYNGLRTQFQRPSSPDGDGFYKASVSFFGPWHKNINAGIALSHIFKDYEKEIVLLQNKHANGCFVNIFEYKLRSERKVIRSTASYDGNDGQWHLNQKDCPEETEVIEDIVKFVFEIPCRLGLDDDLAENFKQFLSKACFTFYDITMEFNFWGESFERASSVDLPAPYNISQRLDYFFKDKLRKVASVGSAQASQNQESQNDQPFEVTAVNYGVAGKGQRLPLWVLGPAGLPLINFDKIFLAELVCEAANLPSSRHCPFEPSFGLPAPNVCLKIPPEHFLSNGNDYFLVLVLSLPLKYNNLSNQASLFKSVEAVAQGYQEQILYIVEEAIKYPKKTEQSTDGFSQSIAASISSIMKNSSNKTFKEECLKILEVNSNTLAQQKMELLLKNQLQENMNS